MDIITKRYFYLGRLWLFCVYPCHWISVFGWLVCHLLCNEIKIIMEFINHHPWKHGKLFCKTNYYTVTDEIKIDDIKYSESLYCTKIIKSMAHDNPSYCFKYIREVNNIRYTNINLCKDETLLNTWFNAMSPLWKIFRNSCLEILCQLPLVIINILDIQLFLFQNSS